MEASSSGNSSAASFAAGPVPSAAFAVPMLKCNDDKPNPAAAPFLASKSLEVIEVDSSWGANNRNEDGGVKRLMWIYNRETGLWAHFHPTIGLIVDKTPYPNHTIAGAFHVK